MGNLTFDTLKDLAAKGEVDTVLVALVDMQGRLMGKRFQAEFFVESAWEETHSCNYLQASAFPAIAPCHSCWSCERQRQQQRLWQG